MEGFQLRDAIPYEMAQEITRRVNERFNNAEEFTDQWKENNQKPIQKPEKALGRLAKVGRSWRVSFWQSGKH